MPYSCAVNTFNHPYYSSQAGLKEELEMEIYIVYFKYVQKGILNDISIVFVKSEWSRY